MSMRYKRGAGPDDLALLHAERKKRGMGAYKAEPGFKLPSNHKRMVGIANGTIKLEPAPLPTETNRKAPVPSKCWLCGNKIVKGEVRMGAHESCYKTHRKKQNASRR